MRHKRLAITVCVASALVCSAAVGNLTGYKSGYKKGVEEQSIVVDKLRSDMTTKDSVIEQQRSVIETLDKELAAKIADLEKLKDIPTTYKMDTFTLTAYSPYDNVSGIENDGSPDSTSTGAVPKDGTISVDPTVIPYGSTVVIIYDDGKIEFGRAEDCGGAIKGNRLDVFRWTYKEATDFGVKKATVLWYKK